MKQRLLLYAFVAIVIPLILLMMRHQYSRFSLLKFPEQEESLSVSFQGSRSTISISNDESLKAVLEQMRTAKNCVNLTLSNLFLGESDMLALQVMPLQKLTIYQCSMTPESKKAVAFFDQLNFLQISGPSVKSRVDTSASEITQDRPSKEWWDDDLANLSTLVSLRELRMYKHRTLTGVGFRTWDSKIELTHLNLYDSSINNEGLTEISKFKNVTRISLKNSAVTPKGMLVLATMPSLVAPPIEDEWKKDKLALLEFGLTYNAIYAKNHPGSIIVPCNYYGFYSDEKLQELLDSSKIFKAVDERTGIGIKRNIAPERDMEVMP